MKNVSTGKFKGILILLLFLFNASSFANVPFSLIQDEATLPLLNPTLVERKTIKIVLPNGLKAALISDPNLDKSGAALVVSVGSRNDPKDYPGMAHFLEHMLFLGTQKYPIESDFDRMVSQNGGITNAFTTPNNTSYFFEIPHNGFKEALDRFAQFFQAPLFNPSGVERELEAINQEYAKNTQIDGTKWYYVIKFLAQKNSPFNAFSMGNKQTLSKISQQALKEWYLQNYSADKMQLVVYSNLPEKDLVDLAVKIFSPIAKREGAKEESEPSYPTLNQLIYIEPVQNVKRLILSWVIPNDLSKEHLSIDVQPWELISHVIGDEGKGSLLDQLKTQGLAEKLSVGSFPIGFSKRLFVIEVEVTALGLKNVDLITSSIFSFIDFLKEHPFPKELFEDIQEIQKLEYQYKFEESLYSLLSADSQMLAEERMESFPERSNIIKTFDPFAVKALLDQLTKKNCQISVMAKSSETKLNYELLEPMLGTSFSLKPIPIDFFKETGDRFIFSYPLKNPYLPENLTTLIKGKLNKSLPHPTRLLEGDQEEIFYAPDLAFHLPQTACLFTVLTPEVNLQDSEKACLADLFAEVLKEGMKEDSYPAKLAGLNFSISNTFNGIEFEFFGFSDRLPLLFKKVLEKAVNLNAEKQIFLEKKETLIRKYENFRSQQPYNQVQELLKKVIYEQYASPLDKLSALKNITFERFKSFIDSIFSSFYIKSLMYGNLSEKEAKELVELAKKTLKGAPYLKKDHLIPSVIILPETGPYFIQKKISAGGNAAFLILEDTHFDLSRRAAQMILTQALKEPFYTALRTIQQTGYLVSNASQEIEKLLFYFFIVQSHTHQPRDLLARFELFLEGYLQNIGKTTFLEKDFLIIKNSILTLLKAPSKNPLEMAQRLYQLAFHYDADFNWMDKRIEACQMLTYETCVSYAKEILGKTNKKRVALLLKGKIPKNDLFDFKQICLKKLQSTSTYQKNSGGTLQVFEEEDE